MQWRQTPVADSWRMAAGSVPQMGSKFCLEGGLGGSSYLIHVPSLILGIKGKVVIKSERVPVLITLII